MSQPENTRKPQNRQITTAGMAVVFTLQRLGVEVVFGIPGNHTVELYRGLSNTNIRHLTTRHEQGATFMADGYARTKGLPGVCILIGGPGLLNGATGITQAQQDSIPMLVITTYSGSKTSYGNLHQMPDQAKAASGMAKKVIRVDHPHNIFAITQQAYKEAAQATPGAVILQIHIDVLTQNVSFSPDEIDPLAPQKVKSRNWRHADVVAQQLAHARSPLILVGGGARHNHHIAELAERLDAPVINTVNGKGIVPASHPLT